MDEGVFMGEKGDFLEKVTRGFQKSHAWFFKKSRVVLSKTSLKRTKESLKSNHPLKGIEPFSSRQAM